MLKILNQGVIHLWDTSFGQFTGRQAYLQIGQCLRINLHTLDHYGKLKFGLPNVPLFC